MIPFTKKFRKCELVYSDRKQISGCLGIEEKGKGKKSGEGKGEISKGQD